MKLIDRFVGRELVVNVLFAIAVLSLVLVVGNIFRKLLPLLVNHDVPLEFLLTFIAYVLPFSLIFTIPWGLLTAILLVFGRLSADNELIALRANGVSVTRVCVPLAVLALVCTAICLWLNVDVAPAAQEKLRSSIFDLATQNPIALFGGDQVIDQFPGRKIYVGKKEGNKLENIIVFQMDEHSLPVRVTHARTGMLETDLPNKRLLLHLYDARYQERDAKESLRSAQDSRWNQPRGRNAADQPGGTLREGKEAAEPFGALAFAVDGAAEVWRRAVIGARPGPRSTSVFRFHFPASPLRSSACR